MENRVNKTVLKNGVKILTQKIPHVRSVSMGVWVNAGARDERPEQSGLSHFIEHMIFKGTRRRDAFLIAKEFDAIGGQSNAFTSMDCTCYHAKVLDSHVSTMVDILSDIFLHSEFNPLEVEKERAVILQEIGMMEDSPEEWAHALLLNSWWGEHPLGQSILGTRESIARFDADTLKAFLNQQYQPGHILITAAGNLDHAQIVDLLLKELDRFRHTPIDSSELANAKQYLMGSILLASENTDNRMSRIAQNEISFGHDIPIPVVAEAIESVTADQVQALAGTLLMENKFAMSILGPESAVNRVAKQSIGL